MKTVRNSNAISFRKLFTSYIQMFFMPYQKNDVIIFQQSLFSFLLRSSGPQILIRKCVLKIYSQFTGGHLCRSAISIKLQTPFPKNTFGRLLQFITSYNFSELQKSSIRRQIFSKLFPKIKLAKNAINNSISQQSQRSQKIQGNIVKKTGQKS